jgi:hypothetical protein
MPPKQILRPARLDLYAGKAGFRARQTNSVLLPEPGGQG